MPFFLYLIISDEHLRYIGHTLDLDKRLIEHNSGCCRFTKQGSNWKILYTEEYPTRSDAMKREKWFKTGVGRQWAEKNIAGWSPPRRSSSLGS